MILGTLFIWFLYVLAAGLLAAVAHLWVLALVGARPRKKRDPPTSHEPLFAVIVPAHNEETTLPELMRSLQALDYPRPRYDVWVIADNCTDRTATIARRWGAECLERRDETHRGKGYALAYGFQRLCGASYDAIVVVDADCVVSRDLLRELARRLASGSSALQTSYRLTAQPGLWSTWLVVENLLEDRLFYGAKERLGLPTLLRGTGMCFTREALRRVPFDCGSITEDVEYTLRLLRAGIEPRFVPEAEVASASPRTLSQMAQQRQRWSAGHMGLALREAPRLLREGLRSRNLRLCEFAGSMLVTSKSALAGLAVVGLLLSVPANHWIASGRAPAWPFLGVLAAISVYFLLGVLLYRPAPVELLRLAGLPFLAIWRMAVHLAAVVSYRRLGWVRTSRG